MYRSASQSSRRNSATAATLAASRSTRSFRFSFLALIACLALAALLAGCAQPAAVTAKSGQTKSTITTAAKPTVPEAEAQTDASSAAPAPATGWQGPTTLVGLGSEDIRAALGAPARIRDEDPARIYQYVGGDCVLDLFFYQEAGTYRVTYAEARSAKAESQPVDACLKSMPSPVVASNTQPST